MKYPTEFKYTSDHEWVFIEGDLATVGITHFALEQLGDVVHIEFPDVDESFDAGESFGTIESTKTVSDLYLPVGGKIVELNDDLLNSLESLAEDPYGDAWLVKIQVENIDESKLMSASDYEEFISE